MNYITRSVAGIQVSKTNEVFELNKSLMAFVNELCLINGSTFQGRREAAKCILKKKSNLPIYVSKKVVLFPTESIRNSACLMVNFMEVSHITEKKDGCDLVFKDCTKLRVKQSFSRISKQLEMCERFSLYMENEKKVFTLDLYK